MTAPTAPKIVATKRTKRVADFYFYLFLVIVVMIPILIALHIRNINFQISESWSILSAVLLVIYLIVGMGVALFASENKAWWGSFWPRFK